MTNHSKDIAPPVIPVNPTVVEGRLNGSGERVRVLGRIYPLQDNVLGVGFFMRRVVSVFPTWPSRQSGQKNLNRDANFVSKLISHKEYLKNVVAMTFEGVNYRPASQILVS